MPTEDVREGTDDARDVAADATAEDATVFDVVTETADASADDGEVRCKPITGSGAFAVQLAGTVTTDGGELGTTAMLLFPKGRVPGAPVVLARSAWSVSQLLVSSSDLDSSTGAVALRIADPYCGQAIEGALLGPDDGVRAAVTWNLSGSSDALLLYKADLKLCASGPITLAPEVSATIEGLRDPVVLRPNVPIDAVTASAVRLLAGGAPVPVKVSVDYQRLQLSSIAGALPLSASSVTLELGVLRDVLGRSFVPTVTTFPLGVPKGVISDRTFATLPAPDAMVLSGLDPKAMDGALLLQAPPPTLPTGAITSALLSLGSFGGLTLTIRHRFDCTGGAVLAGTAALIAGDGTTVELKPVCSSTFVDETVKLPSAGPWFLYLRAGYARSPCNFFSPMRLATYAIDDIALAP